MGMKRLVSVLLMMVVLAFSSAYAEEVSQYVELQKGSRGEAVVKLQERLNELNFDAGIADGIYGNGTATAVSFFQQQNELNITGIADVETQERLFSPDCPVAIEYEELDWIGCSRYPEEYQDRHVQFSGRVLQVMELLPGIISSHIELKMNYGLRVATNGNYDDVVYVFVNNEDVDGRILEDDEITVWGTYNGIYDYKTVLGAAMSIPKIYTETLVINTIQ